MKQRPAFAAVVSALVAAAACGDRNAGLAPPADSGSSSDSGSGSGSSSGADSGSKDSSTKDSSTKDASTKDAKAKDSASEASSGSSSSSGGSFVPGDGGPCDWRNWAPETVATPFASPNDSITFESPTIPCAMFPITQYGAQSDLDAGAAVNTQAFAQAVAAAVAAGGGVVDVPAGNWLTGAIHLDSNIELHLEQGATILFSQDTNDYLPPVLTRWEGLDVMNFSPFVYALGAHDVAVTGPGAGAPSPGILDGQGSTWWGWKGSSSTEDKNVYDYYVKLLQADGTLPNSPLPPPPTSAQSGGLRPTLVECNGCQNFLIDGIQTQNSAYWTLHPLYSTNVIVRNSNITSNLSGSNGDGIDVDSSKDVLIENDTFATSDDIVALKSGLNEDGIAIGKPTEEVVIRNVSSTTGHGISIGSEMSGGIDNIYVTADSMNTLDGLQYFLRIKTLPGRGGVIQNIWYENVTGSDWSKDAVQITTNYGSSTISPHNKSLLPYVENLTVRNVTATGTKPALDLVGLTQAPFQNILFDSVNLTGKGTNGCTAVSGVTLVNSTITGVTGTSISCP